MQWYQQLIQWSTDWLIGMIEVEIFCLLHQSFLICLLCVIKSYQFNYGFVESNGSKNVENENLL